MIFGFNKTAIKGDSNEVPSTRIVAEAKAATGSPESLRVESILTGIESSAPDQRRAIS
jgi:hypothetical protein